MFRIGLAYFLSALVVLTGLVLADARGAAPVPTTDIAICSGTTFTVISIGPDGQPVEKTTPCPDGIAIFAATFSLPELAAPPLHLLAILARGGAIASVARPVPNPSARGPPVLL